MRLAVGEASAAETVAAGIVGVQTESAEPGGTVSSK
jgi:hypothetical protein